MKKILLLAVIFASAVCAALGADDMRRLMTQSHERFDAIFLGQPLNTRLDLIDYYDAGSASFTADNRFGQQIRLDSLSDRHARIATNTDLSFDFYLLTPGSDSLVVTVVNAPLGNTDAAVYVDILNREAPTAAIRTEYADWLTPEALKTVSPSTLLAYIPFVTATAAVDTDNATITLTNNAITVPGLPQEVTELFRPSLTFVYKGGKFQPAKR